MSVKLLTEHNLEFLCLKEGCTDLSVCTYQNATLLEITCHGSFLDLFSGCLFTQELCDPGSRCIDGKFVLRLYVPINNFSIMSGLYRW